MWNGIVIRVLIAGLVVVVAGACGPSQVPAPAANPPQPPAPATTALALPTGTPTPAAAPAQPGAQTKDELLAQWMTLAKSATRATPNIEEGRTIAGQLAAMGPEALNPLFDVMADRASSPFAKTLATMSLVPVLDPRVAPRLLDLTKPENEVTTRVCATSLLGWIQQPEVDAALNELKNDKNRQVRFQALQGLAQKSLEGRKAFGDLWKQPDTTVDERAKIVSVLSNGPFTDSLPIFQEAAGDAKLGEPVRILAIQMLGRAGNPSSLPVLNECAEKDPNPQVQTTAKNAIDAVNKRAEDARALQPPKP